MCKVKIRTTKENKNGERNLESEKRVDCTYFSWIRIRIANQTEDETNEKDCARHNAKRFGNILVSNGGSSLSQVFSTYSLA